MKKRLVLLITLALILVVACVMIFVIFKHEHIQDEEWSFDAQMHYKNVHCTWNICKTSVISYEHVDEDEDRICDICFYRALEHEHTFKYVQYETGHFKQYTCGCPSPDIMGEHYDNDEDCYCDVCGFFVGDEIEWQYSETHHWWCHIFEGADAPGVVYGYGEHINNDADLFCDVCGYLMEINTELPLEYLLRDQVGAEWLYEITADDIVELRITRGYEGVGPGTMRYVFSSTLTAPISRILNEFFNMGVTLIPKEEALVPGGSVATFEFFLNDGTKREFVFNDGCHHDTEHDAYYRLPYCPTFNDVPEYTSYCQFVAIDGWDKCEVWCDTPIMEPYFVCDIPLEELKFNVTDYNVGVGVSTYQYFIETDFGRLGFITNDVFFIVGQGGPYYQLVGKNLDELITEATVGYSVTMNDEEWLYEDLQSRYKAGETVSVKIRSAYDVGYVFFVNGERVMPKEYIVAPYWEFIFTMPENDVVIDFKTYKGFLPKNYDTLYEAIWMNNLDAEYVHIRHYYGEYDSGAIVAMIDSGLYMQVIGKDIVAGVIIHYSDSNRITVLYEGKFYSLLEAYQKGYLTANDIQTIADLHHNQIIPE